MHPHCDGETKDDVKLLPLVTVQVRLYDAVTVGRLRDVTDGVCRTFWHGVVGMATVDQGGIQVDAQDVKFLFAGLVRQVCVECLR